MKANAALAISKKQKAANTRHISSFRPDTRAATPRENKKSVLISGGIEYMLISPVMSILLSIYAFLT
jgi:hypothetical protein